MLSIKTNLSSLIAQTSLKNSTNILNQAVERMSIGYKINHASDNAANYSIATNMTTKIGAYQVAEDNALQGLDMINTASENLSLIEDKLQRLRALATQASNGTYGDKSLSAINAEANALVDELGRTYTTAEYNGLKVFKGTAKFEIPDGVGTTGDVGVQPVATYSMRATNYGDFLANPYTYTDEEVADMKTITQAISESSLVSGGEYSISTKDELVALADYVNAGNNTTGMTFVLGADIDLSSISNWTPIGNYSTNSSYIFKGTFDGNGHTISNLTINRDKGSQGLFGRTSNGSKIRNVGIVSGILNGSNQCGAIAGVSSSDVTNCYSTIEVKSLSADVGGLVGLSYKSIENCYTTGNVSGNKGVGGLVGNTQQVVTNCYAMGDVNGYENVGGLVGMSFDGDIINSYATGNVDGDMYAGGLCGYGYNTDVTNCYAAGDVIGLDKTGGLMGMNSSHSFTIKNSYATGNVNGVNQVGGLVGFSWSTSWHSVQNCYATGNIVGTLQVGGLIGYTSEPYSFSNNYTMCSVNGDSFVGGLFGEMEKTKGSTSTSITNCLSYSTVTGRDLDSTGSLIGGAVVTTDNSTFGTINITSCKAMSQDMNTIGGSYMYASSTYTLLDTYDMSAMTSGISLYVPEITSVTLQVGTSAPGSNQITFDMAFMLDDFNSLSQIGIDTTTDFVKIADDLLSIVSAKQTEYGAIQNRLESALDEISTQYENLVSSRSTLRDADIAEVSADYIRQQILQQASATLMSTANQSPSIALQLI